MHVEVQIKGGRKYYYLVGSVRIGKGRWKKERLYLGKGVNAKTLKVLVKAKKKELEDRIEKTKRSANPLLSLISDKDAKELEAIRIRHQKAKGKMDKIQYQNYYEKFLAEFTYDTNAIEGSTLTLQETAMILFDKIVPKGKQIREINEVQNHKDAFDFMIGYKKDINKDFVLRLHKLLMHNILWKYAGVFRDVQVYVRGADFVPPHPENVEVEFKKLMFWYRRNKKKYNPVVVAAYFHQAFEFVHPFRDGNGRVGRLILNFILRKNKFPLIDIKYRDRSEYYSALGKENKGNLKPLVDLIIEYLRESSTSI